MSTVRELIFLALTGATAAICLITAVVLAQTIF